MKQKTTRGRNFSDFELDVIRFGLSEGKNQAQIAWFLNRSAMAVSRRIREMEEAGTLNELPWSHMAGRVARWGGPLDEND